MVPGHHAQRQHHHQASSVPHQHPHHPRKHVAAYPLELELYYEWHWARDAQLGEDAHRTGAPVFSLLKTVVMNLPRRGGYRSIRQGLRELAYDIKGMPGLGGVTTPGATT